MTLNRHYRSNLQPAARDERRFVAAKTKCGPVHHYPYGSHELKEAINIRRPVFEKEVSHLHELVVPGEGVLPPPLQIV